MYIAKPDLIMEWAKSPEKSYILNIRTNISEHLYENRFAMPTDGQYVEAADFIEEASGIRLDGEQIRGLLMLYPSARINVALDGVSDTEVREALSFAISHFVLGCTWPTYGDKVDVEEFVGILQKRAKDLGFGVKPNES